MWHVVSDGKQFSERPCFVKAGRRRSGTCRSRACKWEDSNGVPPERGVGVNVGTSLGVHMGVIS